jgi:S-formylglutathione hydrolase FrmB
MDRRLSRRALLAGAGGSAATVAGGLALVDTGVLPGRLTLQRALGACDVGGSLPAVDPGRMVGGTLQSAARGRQVTYTIAYPPGDLKRPVPLCLYLHGRGGDHRDAASRAIGLPWILADRVTAGAPPFAIAGVDGGNGYWHRRADGDDPARMLTDELLPHLRSAQLRTDRIALLGASMGGYGALLLAQQLGSERVAAVGALSPALWRRYDDAAPGSFDDEADFAAHDVFAGRQRLAGMPVRLDCGRDDPFAGTTRAFLNGSPATITGAVRAGCHDNSFWRSVAPDHLDRIARALA